MQVVDVLISIYSYWQRKLSPRLSLLLAIITFVFCVLSVKPILAEVSPEVLSKFTTLAMVDQIPYRWDNVERVVAIGDIHGDLNALLKILIKKELIDRNGHWIGRDAHLVMIGDLINGAKNSRAILDYLIGLEKEADFAGGKIHVLLGNHEIRLLFGDIKSMSERNLKALAPELQVREDMEFKVSQDFYSSGGKYMSWLRNKNMMVVINNVAFVHAGLRPEWFEGKDTSLVIQQINTTVRYLLGKARTLFSVDRNLLWTVGLEWHPVKRKFVFSGGLGPIWDRGFGTREYKNSGLDVMPIRRISVPKLELRELLDALGLTKLVVGHHPVRSGKIYLDHPYWKDLVTVLDTKISEAFDGGELSAFEMNLETSGALTFQADNFKRPQKVNRLNRVLAEIKNASIGNIQNFRRCADLAF